jgi:hypothetical protein
MAVGTRGPLPPGVYWRRRLAVLSVALIVFLGVGKVLDLSSDGSSGGKAEQADAPAVTSPTATVSVPEPTKKGGQGKGHGKGNGKGNGKGKGHGQGNGGQVTAAPTPTATPTPVLPDPTGPCADDDVFITPSIPAPIGGSDVTVVLNLQTRVSVACTWQLSASAMRLNIVSGADQIWLSRQCPKSIPTQDVVVRLASVTQVPVVWNAHRSDSECSDRTAWALPGFYHARAAVLGGEPTDVQFELLAPAAPTVTETAQPGGGKNGKNGNGGKGAGGSSQGNGQGG